MQIAQPDTSITVAPGEEFIFRWIMPAGGADFVALSADPGVVHLGTDRLEASKKFGARPVIDEHLRCNLPGSYEVTLSTGRPWESDQKAEKLSITCK